MESTPPNVAHTQRNGAPFASQPIWIEEALQDAPKSIAEQANDSDGQ
jgi:hypothetical protein